MAVAKQKDLVLILARQLAVHVASPIFIVDAEGTLVYFNERAEGTLGARFEEVGELSMEEWGKRWAPRDERANTVPVEELPLSVAILQKRPGHGQLNITALDGTDKTIVVTAIPLFSRESVFVGAVAIFWEPED